MEKSLPEVANDLYDEMYNSYCNGKNRASIYRNDMSVSEYRIRTGALKYLENKGIICTTAKATGFWSFEFTTSTIDDFERRRKPVNAKPSVSSLETMLSKDIEQCDDYLQNPQEDVGRALYARITARYDSIIKSFGDGLYSYIPDHHFYVPDVDISTINHNLSILLQKMITYQAVKYGKNIASGGNEIVLSNEKVFIVHGHDNEAKTETARVIEKLGLKPIVLHEQASGGNTIIEKIERFSDVGFAVVLYTPCDEGHSKTERIPRNRARQNVVFEHGFLIGKLGRNRVCALVKGDIETPGDISGVVYVPMDNAGAWKYRLVDEMNDLGFGLSKDKI